VAPNENKGVEIPGTLTIMVIYLILFTVGFIAMFAYLGGRWPVS